MAIEKISEAVWQAIRRKSPAALPDNPTARGWSAKEIKETFYRFLLDDKDSFRDVIDTLIDNVNGMEGELIKLIGEGNVNEEAVRELISEALKDFTPEGGGSIGSISLVDDGEGNFAIVTTGGGTVNLVDDGEGNFNLEVN